MTLTTSYTRLLVTIRESFCRAVCLSLTSVYCVVSGHHGLGRVLHSYGYENLWDVLQGGCPSYLLVSKQSLEGWMLIQTIVCCVCQLQAFSSSKSVCDTSRSHHIVNAGRILSRVLLHLHCSVPGLPAGRVSNCLWPSLCLMQLSEMSATIHSSLCGWASYHIVSFEHCIYYALLPNLEKPSVSFAMRKLYWEIPTSHC